MNFRQHSVSFYSNNFPLGRLDLGLMTESESAHPNSQTEFAEFAPADETELINDLEETTSKNAESVNDLLRSLRVDSFEDFFLNFSQPSKNSLQEPSSFKRSVAQVDFALSEISVVLSQPVIR